HHRRKSPAFSADRASDRPWRRHHDHRASGMRHLLSIRDLSPSDLTKILALSEGTPKPVLANKGVALYFEKPSARTRNSMELASAQLGGHPVYLQPSELGIGTRESVEDVTHTLACYHAIIAARVFDHGLLERMA